MNLFKDNKSTLGKQKLFIVVLSSLAVIIALLCIVLPIVFKEEEHSVLLVNEHGDRVVATVTDHTGSVITGRLAKMADGSEKNEWNVKKGDGKSVEYTFNLDGAKISYRPFIFDEVPLESVDRVTVTTDDGKISVYSFENGYIIEGAEQNLYNQQSIAELIFQARYMLAFQYVETPSSFADYGLEKENCSAVVEITDKNGKTNTVLVGDEVLSGSGYYMKHTDKDLVYIMDSSVSVFFNDLKSYLSPVVTRPIEEQQRNYIEKFAFGKNGYPFFACRILSDDERVGAYANQLHKMTFPSEEYVLNTMTLYEMFAQVGALSGVAVVEHSVTKSAEFEALKTKYGLDTPMAEIGYTYSGAEYGLIVGKQEEMDGVVYYYVFSGYQDTIVLVPATSMTFLDYELVDLYQTNVFQYNINEISSVDVSYGDKSYSYKLEGEGSSLKVTEANTSKVIDTPSFRQFYISILNVTIGGYSAINEEDADKLKHELTYKVTLEDGSELVYEFYSESTMSCHMRLDGKGGFKTDRKWIEKIIENSDKLISGIEIGSAF